MNKNAVKKNVRMNSVKKVFFINLKLIVWWLGKFWVGFFAQSISCFFAEAMFCRQIFNRETYQQYHSNIKKFQDIFGGKSKEHKNVFLSKS